MNYNLFIAKKIAGKGSNQKVSSLSNKIATVSISISLIVMIIAVAIALGFKDEVGDKAKGFSGQIIFSALGVEPNSDIYPIKSDLSYKPMVSELKGVKTISNVAYSPGMLKTTNYVQGVVFKGVDSTYNFDFFANHLVEGDLPQFTGKRPSNEILISTKLANILGYKVGDKLIAYYIKETTSVRSFIIAGLYQAELEDIDKTLTLVDIRHIRRLNGWQDNEVSSMELMLDDGVNESALIGKIEQIMSCHSKDEDGPVVVRSVRELYPHLFDWLDLMDLNVIIVLGLMILVAGFNMISGLLIILFEKIAMIGLLKSLGMQDKSIVKVFIYRGSFLLNMGMLWGNIIGLTFICLQKYCKIIPLDSSNYFVNYVPIKFGVVEFLTINIAAYLLIILVMYIPTLFIAKISPDKSIKLS